jgi:hypothetical protein
LLGFSKLQPGPRLKLRRRAPRKESRRCKEPLLYPLTREPTCLLQAFRRSAVTRRKDRLRRCLHFSTLVGREEDRPPPKLLDLLIVRPRILNGRGSVRQNGVKLSAYREK